MLDIIVLLSIIPISQIPEKAMRKKVMQVQKHFRVIPAHRSPRALAKANEQECIQ